MLPIYLGFDPREEAGSHTFCSSVIHRSSRPVSFCHLHLPHFKSFYSSGLRDGTNAFIYTRFLIPFLQGFKGWAIFADGADMVCLADIAELWALRDSSKAVQVVKHSYQTRHPRKYVGTAMEAANDDYPRKNWSSLMLINCQHPKWLGMKPERVEEMTGAQLHRFSWLDDELVGELPTEWNWLSQEYGPNPLAKIVHYTVGVPAFPAYSTTEMADEWAQEALRARHVTR